MREHMDVHVHVHIPSINPFHRMHLTPQELADLLASLIQTLRQKYQADGWGGVGVVM